MSVTAVRTPAEYEAELQRYLFERAEEGRAVRVGEKEVSERAEIVARYAELFTRDQLERSEEHTSELQSLRHLVCRLLLEKKKKIDTKKSARNETDDGCGTSSRDQREK